MNTQQNNQPAGRTGNLQSCIQQRQNQQPITDEHIKQIIMDTLIELNLVQQVQKKKVLAVV